MSVVAVSEAGHLGFKTEAGTASVYPGCPAQIRTVGRYDDDHCGNNMSKQLPRGSPTTSFTVKYS